MSVPNTIDEFLELLTRSHLLSQPLMEKLIPQVRGYGDKIDTPKKLAQVLCKNNVLTVYQAGRLLKGQWDSFYIGKFKILEVLGRGGMGKVFLAEQVSMHRLVALKVMRSSIRSRPDTMARFTREAQAIAALNHPNIIRAYDFDEIDGLPYIVMEYVDGIDVEHQVKSFSPLHWSQASDYLLQAATGLQHAHEQNLVHRDVKPANLLVNTKGGIKLLDMGLVATLQESDERVLTNDTDQLGSVDYISPEQALNSHEVDIRTDIYSLGAVYYFMLTGLPLFPGTSTSQKLLMHQTQEPRSIQDIVTDLPAEIPEIIGKMLAKKPEDRYQTPQEVVDAVAAHAERKVPPYPIKAVQYTQGTMQQFLRRGPSASGLSGIQSHYSDSFIQSATAEPAASPANDRLKNLVSSGVLAPRTPQSTTPASSTAPPAEQAPPPTTPVQKPETTPVATRNPFWITLAVGLFLSVGVGAAYWFWFRNPIVAKETIEPGEKNETLTPQPQLAELIPPVTPSPERLEQWKQHQTHLQNDPTLQVFLAFDQNKTTTKALENLAKQSSLTNLTPVVVNNPDWSSGRFPGRLSVRLGGPSTQQHISLGDSSAESLNFSGSLTVAVWFRTAGFRRQSQTPLISKGGDSWRLQQSDQFRFLSFATNPAFTPEGQPIPLRNLPEVRGTRVVDDGRWHLAVGVQRVEDFSVTTELYLDGVLEGRRTLQETPVPNQKPVLVGTSSDEPSADAKFFQGEIDEVLIFSRALNGDDIQKLFASGNPYVN